MNEVSFVPCAAWRQGRFLSECNLTCWSSHQIFISSFHSVLDPPGNTQTRDGACVRMISLHQCSSLFNTLSSHYASITNDETMRPHWWWVINFIAHSNTTNTSGTGTSAGHLCKSAHYTWAWFLSSRSDGFSTFCPGQWSESSPVWE